MKTARRRDIVALSSLLVIMCAGCQGGIESASANSELSNSNAVAVKVVTPQKTTLQRTTTQPATVRASHVAELHAKVAGYLKELAVDIGDSVKAGAVLGVIDVPEIVKQRERQEAMVRRLRADEKRATAAVALATANVDAAEAARDQARADIAMKDAQLTADQAEFNRVEDLVSKKAVASRLLDEVRKQLESSQAAKLAVESALKSAEADVSVARAKLAVAEADSEAARTQTEVAQKQLEETDAMMAYATLRAPFDGVVIQRDVDPGDLVRNTQSTADGPQQPLFAVARLDTVRVCVMVPENDAPWVGTGDALTVMLRAIPDRQFEGKISRTARSLDESTRTMLVEADLPNPDGVLLPGMYGRAAVVLDESVDSLVLPAGAVRHDEEGHSYVYVVSGDDTVGVVDVTTGLDDGQTIEITSGLSGDERVVDAILGRLKPGQKVRVQDR